MSKQKTMFGAAPPKRRQRRIADQDPVQKALAIAWRRKDPLCGLECRKLNAGAKFLHEKGHRNNAITAKMVATWAAEYASKHKKIVNEGVTPNMVVIQATAPENLPAIRQDEARICPKCSKPGFPVPEYLPTDRTRKTWKCHECGHIGPKA